MSDLMLYSGGHLVSAEELAAIPTPARTPTWTPIPHLELLEAVRREVIASGLGVIRQQLAISNGAGGQPGDRFFGLLEIGASDRGSTYALTVGLRNGHDRSIVAGLCMGSRTLVCSNLAFSAEVVIARKHTSRIRMDLPRLITSAVGRLGDLRDQQSRRIEAYQNTPLANQLMHDLAVRSIDAGVLAASKLPKLLYHWREPEHPEFEPRTVWSAFNGFTEVLKQYDLQDLPRRTTALHGLCDMLCHLS
jgi:hypothetical protein